ncbi:quinone oxidoreductase [Paenibacillus filicis]|uniref:Quinone oxidoreductase n=1 Tax=Paenibacillus gyeongsangnamensis TaxID=3388067 RepID=A0ABT4QC85_9BACL|nr:quinone oxidoreductase [Paenibacillus filicis]MCZ8514487.1 quinone oxidoreductase [Paenibacillus filicis]
MKALIFKRFGEPEVLHIADVPDPAPQPDALIVRTRAIGLNYADIYRRRGSYHLEGEPPYILGYEGAGIVEDAPEGSGFQPGDRVAFADVPFANAELVSVPAERAIPLPEGTDFDTAAALLLQGMTAHYLVHDSFRVKEGDEVLVHAAAGGVGQLLVQLCKLRGARVLGLTSSEKKRQAALSAGADEVLLYGEENWPDRALKWSRGGAGLDAAYDSVGATLLDSFAAVKKLGTVVFFGMAGGDPPFIDPRMLMDTSKTLTGGDLWNHVTTREDRIARAGDLFRWVAEGRLRLTPPHRFPLQEGAEAHRWLESRASTGKILLIP